MRLSIRSLARYMMCVALLLACLFCHTMALADESHIHLTVNESYNEQTPMEGATVCVYRVAEIADGHMHWLSAFGAFNNTVTVADDITEEMTKDLLSYVTQNNIGAVASDVTDKNGASTFTIEQDPDATYLYLVETKAHVQGGYTYYTQPMLVALPYYNVQEDALYRSVTINPKQERVPFEQSDESVAVHVVVVWIDQGLEQYRPKTVDVSLIRDDVVLDTATIGPAENWRHTWSGLHRQAELGMRYPQDIQVLFL